MPKRSREEKRKRAEDDAKLAEYVDRKYRLAMRPVIQAVKAFEAQETDVAELDAVIHGYAIVAQGMYGVLTQSRTDLLALVEKEEHGDAFWNPTDRLRDRRWQRSDGQRYLAFFEPTLDEVVAEFNAMARFEGRPELARSTAEWQQLVLDRMKRNDIGGFLVKAIGGEREWESKEELESWMEVAQEIWNSTPMPDRGGLTPKQMLRRA